ncbi:MAG TPA: TRAP transporter TatT component family protein [Vicinamibacterales bacterium]|nr:TRAP transporter TatT component family protein [Vicinamibacterales bacterium]
MLSRAPRLAVRLFAAGLTAVALAGCGMIKRTAINNVAGTLSSSGDVFTRDNDPELVREALPFALKLYESLLESVPKNEDLLVATCAAFTQYGYAFVETDADVLGEAHHDEAKALRERALKLYIRAKDYCLRGAEVRFPGITPKLLANPEPALKKAGKKDVPLLYWTAASWGAAISLGLDKPDLVVDHPTVRALAERALALDPTWSHGAIHEALITLDSLPEALGGSPARAREHFARAVEIQKGLAPGPYVELAMGVAVPAQDRAEFTKLLNDAIAIDPEKDPSNRLVTLIMQRRARALLDQIDTLFAK